MMEQRRPPEYILEVFADPTSVKDVVKGAIDNPQLMFYAPPVEYSLLTADLRYITHNIFPQILPLYSTQNERRARPHPTSC